MAGVTPKGKRSSMEARSPFLRAEKARVRSSVQYQVKLILKGLS